MLTEQQQQTIETTTLLVMEAFYTVQGKGIHTGRAAATWAATVIISN
ncbi:hypothetical protein [Spirosoma rhododendri]|nr:hypothetical protein [Spirosoma rhododendri]